MEEDQRILWNEFVEHECYALNSVDDALPSLLKMGYSYNYIVREYNEFIAMCLDHEHFDI